MLKDLLSNAREFYHLAQLDAFFTWLGSKSFSESFFVFIDLSHQTETLDVRRHTVSSTKDPCGFIICQPGMLLSTLSKLATSVPKEAWHRIWHAHGIEIWENKKLHGDVLPLRFGLSQAEKKALLVFARETMGSFFDTKLEVDQPDISPHWKNEKTRIDVGIWIDGQLRGSIISPLLPLLEALGYASRGALRDPRMKPVESDELPRARIEITLMSDLVLPLQTQDIQDEKMDACKGYYVEADSKRGWYLPMVFNRMKFKDMSGLKSSLIQGKADIMEEESFVVLHAFQTEGWIEAPEERLLLLEGPTAYAGDSVTEAFLDRVRAHSWSAAAWLAGMCDTHGALPLFIDPLTGQVGRMDWGRLAHASYALATFGAATGNERSVRVSEKISSYIERYLFDPTPPGTPIAGGVAAYLLHAALARADNRHAPLVEYLRAHPVSKDAHPIMSAVCASLFARLALAGEKKYQVESETLAAELVLDFKHKKSLPRTQLALYPELIYTFDLLYELTHDPRYEVQSEEVALWLTSQQLPQGSFPIWPRSYFAYTRGTGKIFEVLALHPDRYDSALKGSFDWLTRMQYTEESLYFVEASHRTKVLGGFRHDHTNTEAWIDAASHVLLGAARLLAPGTPGDK